MNWVYILITLNLLILLLHVRFTDFWNEFESAAVNLLFIVSVYAIWATGFKTIYIVPFLVILCVILWKGFSISFHLDKELIAKIVVGNLLCLLFASIYFFPEMQLRLPLTPYDDFSIYSRIAFYNDLFGTENLHSFYNLLFKHKQFQLYHHFELWFMNFCHFVNGSGRLMNLFFVGFPLVGLLSVLGIKILYKLKKIGYGLLIFMIAIISVWPYDIALMFFNLKLPLGSSAKILLLPKTLFVLPILIQIISELKRSNTYYITSSLFLFYYPLVVPVIAGSLVLKELCARPINVFKIIAPGSICLLFLMFMFFIAERATGLDFRNLVDYTIYPKVFYSGILIPVISFAWLFFAWIRIKDLKPWQDIIVYFVFALGVSLILWILFYKNLDANQLYRNVFSPLSSLGISFSVWFFYKYKYYKTLILALVIYIIPVTYVYYSTGFVHTSNEEIEIAKTIKQGSKVLYLPPHEQINTTYWYNEVMFLPINTVFLKNENFHLINIAAAYSPSFPIQDPVRRNMIDYYRSASPFFSMCGEISNDNLQCVEKFMIKNSISLLLIDKRLSVGASFIKVKSFPTLTLYQVNSGK